uniref:Uncharacterized protein n=1 Tax=Oncorhynchus mykiss TaxID=8022 RepID=A0A8K9UKT6_ONCMY
MKRVWLNLNLLLFLLLHDLHRGFLHRRPTRDRGYLCSEPGHSTRDYTLLAKDRGYLYYTLLVKDRGYLCSEPGLSTRDYTLLAKDRGYLCSEPGLSTRDYTLLAKDRGYLCSEPGLPTRDYTLLVKDRVEPSGLTAPQNGT